jgi:hypothetical protein
MSSQLGSDLNRVMEGIHENFASQHYNDPMFQKTTEVGCWLLLVVAGCCWLLLVVAGCFLLSSLVSCIIFTSRLQPTLTMIGFSFLSHTGVRVVVLW